MAHAKRRSFQPHQTRAQQAKFRAAQRQYYRELEASGKGLRRTWKDFSDAEKATVLARVTYYRRHHVGAPLLEPYVEALT
jgi:hypothetical protein